jgi:hypothetical protein
MESAVSLAAGVAAWSVSGGENGIGPMVRLQDHRGHADMDAA